MFKIKAFGETIRTAPFWVVSARRCLDLEQASARAASPGTRGTPDGRQYSTTVVSR
jgi:hypothetical protein